MKPLISMLLLTIDRFEITKIVLEKNLAGCLDYPVELLVADNGSKDRRVIDYIASHPRLAYHRINSQNEGVSRSLNQLMIRAKGEYIAQIGNDIECPHGWLHEFIQYAKAVPRPGLIGMKCTAEMPPCIHKFGVNAHFLDAKWDKVFGPTFYRRDLLDDVGGYCEEYHPYGLEDSDFNNRINVAKYNSLYVPTMVSIHHGDDVGQTSEYRKMKDASLQHGLGVHSKRVPNYARLGYYEPLPELREPI